MFKLSKLFLLTSVLALPAFSYADTIVCQELKGGLAKVSIDQTANTMTVEGLVPEAHTFKIKSVENTFTNTLTFIAYSTEINQYAEIAVELTGRTSTLQAEGTSAYMTCQVR